MLYERFLTIYFLCTIIGVQASGALVQPGTVTLPSELNIRFVSDSLIKQHGKNIARTFKTRYWSQIGVQTVSGTAIVWMAYSYITGSKIVSADQLHTSDKVVALVVNEVQKAMRDGNYPKPNAGSWFDTIVNYGKALGGYMILAKANNIITKLFDDPSIKWFALEKTELDTIHKEIIGLKADMKLLKAKQIVIGSQRIKHYVDHVVSLRNSLVANIEKVIAYVTYSIDELKLSHNNSLDYELRERLQESSQQMHDLTGKYVATDDTLQRIDYILKMFALVEFLDTEVRSSLQGFARLEDEARNS